MKAPILRRTKIDLAITAGLSALTLIGIAGVWATAPSRNVDHQPGEAITVNATEVNFAAPAATEVFQVAGDPFNQRAIISSGLIISTEITEDSSTIRAINPENGEEVWHYSRDRKLCSLSQAWDNVIMDFHSGRGCGDVVSVHGATGEYVTTRSASASNEVAPISSNDRVGIVSPERVELWRSDLVRTVEYGDVPIKQEAEQQPHEECTISSALTRTEILAVVEQCDDHYWLRLQKTTPHDSREPSIIQDFDLGTNPAQVVAVNQTGAAVYISSANPEIIAYNELNEQTARSLVAPAPLADTTSGLFTPQTGDLPHHMTWFDGQRLYLFAPSKLNLSQIFENALGAGAATNDRLLIPISQGIAVANWTTGEIESTIAVDRHGYTGPITLSVNNGYIVEKRGSEIVVLKT
ncbi:putative secreted protein [Corynebacterium kutscheri]|uniref:Secreted protein n=1 Tax=Corynebacterium kutscheri TaxID=35755 RepID=A0AB38VWM7_9CORY|nr:hypothetical protein [Corynebacterium kutscheri]VEH06287.1 putative secreted protein [Corynebacterium kutscheri]VEH82200.1 putative secreted protein [Corynebacterium kutscheri]